MLSVEENLVGLFYESATNPALWGQALSSFADATNAIDAHIVALDKITGEPTLAVAGSRGQVREMLADYTSHWAARDPLIPRMLSAPKSMGSLMLCHEYLKRREISQSEYYQDFLIPHGLRYQAAWVLEDSPATHAVIGLHRHHAEFERATLERWGTVIGHLQRAVQPAPELSDRGGCARPRGRNDSARRGRH
jgi:hypothetical protein